MALRAESCEMHPEFLDKPSPRVNCNQLREGMITDYAAGRSKLGLGDVGRKE
jgi:hypothetical protein